VAFTAGPDADDAVRLRRWDDQAKVDGLEVDPFAAYLELLSGLTR
jgi:predicted HD phosphohydrolase